MRRYPLNQVLNMRDLGGYPTSRGGCTQFGRFIRSDAPLDIPESDSSYLLSIGISTVVDLRSLGEVERGPCAFASISGFSYHHCPMHVYTRRLEHENETGEVYFLSAKEEKTLAQVMTILAGAPKGALFHCTAGKDRTGITAAILLLLAGVSRSDILADYQVSHTYLRKLVQELLATHPDMPAYMGRSEMIYMDLFLDLFLNEYGSAEHYLKTIGLSGAEISALKSKLLDADAPGFHYRPYIK